MNTPVIMQEWETRTLPSDLAEDKEFLGRLANLFDRQGGRIFDLILRSDGGVAIKARNYVGIFAIKDSKGRDIILVIEPKIGVKNIVWMLSFNEARSFREIREIETVLSIPADKKSIMDLLVIGVIRRFMERLSQALIYGFMEMPSVRIEESTVVRGRILSSELPRSLLANPTPKVVCEVQYYTTNNVVNQYILDAGYMLYLGAFGLFKIIGADVNTSILTRALFELDYTPSTSLRSVNIRELLLEAPLDRPYIHELLRLAAVIRRWLEHGQPPRLGGIIGVPALYINMNKLFESFIRKMMVIVARWLRRTKGINITVRGAGKSERALVISPRSAAYLRPDIVVEVNGVPVAVGDVKYRLVRNPLKSGPGGDREAINQIYTFIHGWNVKKGFLVYPSLESNASYECYMLRGRKKLYIIRVCINETPKTFKEFKASNIFSVFSDFLLKLADQ